MVRSRTITSQCHIQKKDIVKLAESIAEKYDPEKIILFGSYAQGNPNPASDVDLLIIIDTDQSPRKKSVDISCSFKHTFPIDIIVRTPKEITERLQYGDFFMKEIVDNGKVLYERTGQ